MLLRSGKSLNYNEEYENIKTRCFTIYPLKTVKKEQVTIMRTMLNSTNNGVNKDNVNHILKTVLTVPELIANYPTFRRVVILRLNEILNHGHFLNIIDKSLFRASSEYFEWLKLRSDYEEDPLIIMELAKARTNIIKEELIEKLYHPDRYEHMIAIYGEIWADIHFD
jgi:hypothetical protein